MHFSILFTCALAIVVFGAEYRVGQKFQIILSNVVAPPSNPSTKILPSDAEVFDIDMFQTPASTIALLQAQGKIVICYFSAGTYEPYRPDSGNFTSSDKGPALPEWPDEYWLRVTNSNVRKIMTSRIEMAAAKGCDGIDPDNTDAYANPTGNTTVTESQAIDYIHFLADLAKSFNMTIGLKNSLQILPSVSGLITFAVNEECAHFQECYWYRDLIAAGKPVYQIEYPSPIPPSPSARSSACPPTPSGLSVIFKNLSLDGLATYCDGSVVNTDTKPGGVNAPPPRPTKTTSRPHPSTSPPPGSTKTSTTTYTPTTRTTTRTTSQSHSSIPVSSPSPSHTGGGGGCISKHWDQCGGQDWKGCTVCASGFSCKYSNPYYSQCL